MRARSSLTAVFSLVSCLYSRRVVCARVKSCDDGWVQSSACVFVLPDPDVVEYCRASEILALRRGCFVCVDPHTCEDPRDAHSYSVHGQLSKESWTAPSVTTPAPAPLPSGTVGESVEIHPKRNEHPGEQGILVSPQQQAQAVSASATSPKRKRIGEVSNWLFTIPACLALVSIGIALRGRYVRKHEHFDRVEDEDREEINPFCSDPRCSPHADDVDLEFGDQLDSDDSEGEASNNQ